MFLGHFFLEEIKYLSSKERNYQLLVGNCTGYSHLGVRLTLNSFQLLR
jgi:hypothetical protein